MKILITHELFPPDFAGGGEKIMEELAIHLVKKGAEVKVLTTGDKNITTHKGVQTIRLHRHRYLFNTAVRAVMKEARDCDLIQTSSYNAFLPAWAAGKLLHKPVICYAMGLYGKKWLKMRGPVWGTLSRFGEMLQMRRSFDRMVFLSDYSREWAKEIGIAGEHTRVINPGVEVSDFRVGKKEWFVLFVGRFAKQKGVDDIIAVARSLPTINFVMVGWGEEEERLKKIAPQNITFYNGHNNKAKVIDLYAKADVAFFPSVGETFGLVITEAMASGCAIVSTIPLTYEGYVVQPGDTKTMTEKVQFLMDHRDLAQEMGRKNAELAKSYSWEHFADQFLHLYREVLAERARKS